MSSSVPVSAPEEAEYYDIRVDPMEQSDLASVRTDDVAGYRELAEKYLADDRPPWGVGAGTVELEEMQLNQLKALGYKIEN